MSVLNPFTVPQVPGQTADGQLYRWYFLAIGVALAGAWLIEHDFPTAGVLVAAMSIIGFVEYHSRLLTESGLLNQ